MPKTVHNDVLDGAFAILTTNAVKMTICNTPPTSYTEAVVTYCLASFTISGANYTGPADGDTSGRKLTVNAQTGGAVLASGDARWITLCSNLAGNKLYYITSCTTQTLTSGNTVNTPAWKIEIADPV